MNTFWGVLMQGGFATLFGVIAGIIVLGLLKSESLFEIWAAARRKFWKVDLVTSEELSTK